MAYYNKALKYYKKSFHKMRERSYTGDHRDLARSLNSIA